MNMEMDISNSPSGVSLQVFAPKRPNFFLQVYIHVFPMHLQYISFNWLQTSRKYNIISCEPSFSLCGSSTKCSLLYAMLFVDTYQLKLFFFLSRTEIAHQYHPIWAIAHAQPKCIYVKCEI